MTIVEQLVLAIAITGFVLLWARLSEPDDVDEKNPMIRSFRDRTEAEEYGRKIKGRV